MTTPRQKRPELRLEDGNLAFLKIALAVVIGGCLATALLVVFAAPQEYRRLAGLLLAALAAGTALTAMRRGRAELAYGIFAWGTWTAITIAAAINGGMAAAGILAYPIVILFAGWVVGVRTVLALAALTLVAESLFVVGADAGWLPQATPLPGSWLLIAHAIIVGVAASLAVFVRRGVAAQLEAMAQRDAELSQQHKLYGTLLDAQSSAGVGLFILENGRIAFSNEAGRAIYGYSETELAALPSFGAMVHPDDRERVVRNHQRRLAGEKFNNRYDIGILTKAGERREAEITVALLDQSENPRVLVIMVDITERKQAQEAARLSEDRFAKVFNVSPVAASIAAASDGRFIEVNDVYTQYFGWPREQMIGRTSVEIGLWPGDSVRQAWADELARRGTLRDYETVWLNCSGEPRNVRISAVTIELGGVPCILALVHDITELRQSELRFSQVFRVSPVAAAVARLEDGRHIEVNNAFRRMLGWSREETVGHTSIELGIWPDAATRDAWIEQLRTQGTVLDYEAKLRNRTGEERIVSLSAEMVDFGGERCILSFLNDITERRRSEAMLREIVEGTSRVTGTEFFHALVRHLARALGVPHALVGEVAVADPGRLRTLAFWSNDRFAAEIDYDLAITPCGRVFDSGEPQLMNGNLAANFPEAAGMLSASGIQSYFGYPLTSSSGESLGVLAIMDKEPIQAGGERASLMAIFAARASAELERQRAENEVRWSEQKFSRIFHTSPVATSISRISDGRFLEVNDAYVRQFGWAREDMLSRSSVDIGLWARPDDRTHWIAFLLRTGRVADYEALMRDRGGRERTILISAELIDFGGEQCALSFLYDITERKQAEAQIRQLNAELEDRVKRRTIELTEANRELESFAYSISHDLRAPLRGIDGFSRLLQEEYGERLDQQGNDYLVRVRRATQRLGTLIDDLLELSRVTRHDMQRADVDLSAVTGDVVEDLRRTEPERKVEVVVGARCGARGDPQLLRVLLENLVGNAWKYSRHNPAARIEFGCQRSADETRFYVRDNGVGFDMAYVGKLFSPFQRLHTPGDFEGSGIGLASAARVVRRHGGRIWAESSPGAGATFFFTLDGHGGGQ